jgi:lysophospholipase L1-like esterase
MADERAKATAVRFAARVAYWVAVFWIQIGLTLVLFWIVSAAAGLIVKKIRHASYRKPPPEEAYRGAPWVGEYFTSLNRVRMRWNPYSYWKGSPMSSPNLNIDAMGNRVTWHARRAGGNGRGPLRIFMMGGSTMWGTGVRDDYTVASLMARRLAGNPAYDAEVTNYAQIGYVSTQELLLLYDLLRRGQRPDLVIFYDGVNECFTAYQNGIGGLTQSEFFRVQEFSILGAAWGRKKLYRTTFRTALMNTGLADLVKLLSGKDDPNTAPHEVKPLEILGYLAPPQDYDGTAAVQRDAVDIYLFNIQVARMLGERYGFRCLFYWQPVVFTKNKLNPFERGLIDNPGMQQFVVGTYQRLAPVAAANGVRDLSGILRDRENLDFIDPWHLTESANRIIADRMAADATAALADRMRDKAAAPAKAASPRSVTTRTPGAGN